MDADEAARAAVAADAARAGAAVAAESFRTDLAVETKSGDTDVVTEADRAAQRRVAAVVAETYPDETVVGEEGSGPKSLPDSGPAWIVDPIDGTNNYVRGLRTWTTSVAAVVDGEAVGAATVMPALDDAYVLGPNGPRLNGDPIGVSERSDPWTCRVVPTTWWPPDERAEFAAVLRESVSRFGDVHRVGSAQAVLAGVASGAYDAALATDRPNPWDTVAGVALVRAAGGRVTDLAGDPWQPDSDALVASNGEIHDEVLAATRAATGWDE